MGGTVEARFARLVGQCGDLVRLAVGHRAGGPKGLAFGGGGQGRRRKREGQRTKDEVHLHGGVRSMSERYSKRSAT